MTLWRILRTIRVEKFSAGRNGFHRLVFTRGAVQRVGIGLKIGGCAMGVSVIAYGAVRVHHGRVIDVTAGVARVFRARR